TVGGEQLTISRVEDMVFINGIRVEATGQQVNGQNFKVYILKNLLYYDTYQDPHADEYFIEYSENGWYKKVGTSVSPWYLHKFLTEGIITLSRCEMPVFNTNISSKPWRLGPPDLYLKFNRKSGDELPKVRTYLASQKEMALGI